MSRVFVDGVRVEPVGVLAMNTLVVVADTGVVNGVDAESVTVKQKWSVLGEEARLFPTKLWSNGETTLGLVPTELPEVEQAVVERVEYVIVLKVGVPPVQLSVKLNNWAITMFAGGFDIEVIVSAGFIVSIFDTRMLLLP